MHNFCANANNCACLQATLLYAAALRQQAYEVLHQLTGVALDQLAEHAEDHVKANALFRRSAGVCEYVRDTLLPELPDKTPPERSAAVCMQLPLRLWGCSMHCASGSVISWSTGSGSIQGRVKGIYSVKSKVRILLLRSRVVLHGTECLKVLVML